MKDIKKMYLYALLVAMISIVSVGCKKDIENSVDYSTANPFNGKTTVVFNLNKVYGTMTDQDGNIYKTINIGLQTWMAENLRTTIYQNGEKIIEFSDNTAWGNLNTGAYCNYNNTRDIDTIASFGRLYNWFAVRD